MNKAELINALVENQHFLNKAQADQVLSTLSGIVCGELKAGNEVTLPGIGKLKPHAKPARKGRNPSTGETVDIPAKTVVKLSVAKELKEAVA